MATTPKNVPEMTDAVDEVVGSGVTDGAVTEAEEFPMPPEFEADMPSGRVHSTDDLPASGTQSTRSGSSGIDDLGDMDLDNPEDEVERKKLDAPTGDWQKEDRWEFERYIKEDDSMLGDKSPLGRTYFNVKGHPRSREENGITYEPMLFLRISPDLRRKVDKPTEVDLAHKLYLLAKDLYLELKEEKVTDARKFVSMLVEDNYVVRTMNGDTGPVVVGLKSGKRNRGRR